MIGRWVPRVGLAIPSWGGAAMIGETVASALAQTGVDLRVVVGLDGPDPETEAALAPWAGDARLSVVVRPERLGWVDNTTATLRDAMGRGATHVGVLPHDDLVTPDYCGVLLRALSARPKAAVVYTDIELFGSKEGVLSQDSVEGRRFDRVATLMREHYNAIPYSGLMTAGVARRVLPIRGNAAGDFAVDTAWMFRMALEGSLVRVPKVLFRKRYHPGNTHMGWLKPPRTARVAAWAVHCRHCLEEGLPAAETAAQEAELRQLAAARLWWAPRYVGALSEEHRAMLAAAEREILAG